MEFVSFALDGKALLVAIGLGLLAYFLERFSHRFLPPQIYISDLAPFTQSKNWRAHAGFSNFLKYAALAAFLLAFIDPRVYIEQKDSGPQLPDSEASHGIALYLVLDQSGSMTEKINVPSSTGLPTLSSKIDLLKQLTKQFIMGDRQIGLTGRPSDLVGLVEFARTARVVVPLTLDHRPLVEKLDQFHVVKNKEDDGTAIGYAIYKTTNLIAASRNFARDLISKGKPAYEIKSSVIVLVTDGLQDPNPADIGSQWRWIDPLEAAQFAKDNHVRLYIVNIEPAFNTEKFSANRAQMQKTANLTGGKFFMLSNSQSLADIYAEIDKLEKSTLPVEQELINTLRKDLSRDELPNIYKRHSFYPFLISFGLLCLALWAILETLLFRKVP